MSLCEHCACRGSWDCEDGYCCPDNSGNFKHDYDTLTKNRKRG